MEEILKKLGLTYNEIRVYMTFLELGENTVGPIIKKLNIHRQIAYNALDSLMERNMVVKITKNNRNYYKIADPQNILENIKLKEQLAISIIPEISERMSGQRKGQEIKIYEGEKAYRDLVLKNEELMPAGSTTYVISGGSGRFFDLMKKTGALDKSNRIRTAKNIQTKILYSHDMKKKLTEDLKKNRENRFLSHKISPPISIQLWHDSVNLISFGSDVFVIEIKNEDFYQAYLDYFNIFWAIAKE